MIQNPYVSPTTIVDIDFATTENSRPLLVWVASFLLCVSLVTGYINTALRWDNKGAAIMANMPINYQILLVCMMIAGALIFLWLTYKIWCGRNWARIVMPIVIAIRVLPLLPKMPSMLEHMTIHEYLTFAQTIAELLGVYIVFATSARHWFARSSVDTKLSRAGETRVEELR